MTANAALVLQIAATLYALWIALKLRRPLGWWTMTGFCGVAVVRRIIGIMAIDVPSLRAAEQPLNVATSTLLLLSLAMLAHHYSHRADVEARAEVVVNQQLAALGLSAGGAGGTGGSGGVGVHGGEGGKGGKGGPGEPGGPGGKGGEGGDSAEGARGEPGKPGKAGAGGAGGEGGAGGIGGKNVDTTLG